MLETLASLVGDYYGLDWITLMFGVSASFLISNMGRLCLGLTIGILACMCGLTVAILSDQNGFVVYNLILITINVRGLLINRRKEAVARASLAPRNEPAIAAIVP